MAGLVIQNGKGYKVPECPKCGSRMLPKDLDCETEIWKCPYCMAKVKVKDGMD